MRKIILTTALIFAVRALSQKSREKPAISLKKIKTEYTGATPQDFC